MIKKIKVPQWVIGLLRFIIFVSICIQIHNNYHHIKILEDHLNITAQKLQDVQYQLDVLAELQREMK